MQPMPAHAWAKASANGPILDFTKPANAKKIYDFLATESRSVSTYASNPLWRVVDGPYKLTSFNSTTGAFTMVPNPSYGGPHSAQVPSLQAVPFTSDTAEFDAVKAGSIDIGYMPQTDVPQVSQVKAAGYNVFGYPDFGFSDVSLQLQGHDRRLQPHHRAAVHPAGDRASPGRGPATSRPSSTARAAWLTGRFRLSRCPRTRRRTR